MSVHSAKKYGKSALAVLLAVGMIGLSGCDQSKKKKSNRKRVDKGALHDAIEERISIALEGPAGLTEFAIRQEVDNLMTAIQKCDFNYFFSHTDEDADYYFYTSELLPVYQAEMEYLTYTCDIANIQEDSARVLLRCTKKSESAMEELMTDTHVIAEWIETAFRPLLSGVDFNDNEYKYYDNELLAERYKEKLEAAPEESFDIYCTVRFDENQGTYWFEDGSFYYILPIEEPLDYFDMDDDDIMEIYSEGIDLAYKDGEINDTEYEELKLLFSDLPMPIKDICKIFESHGLECDDYDDYWIFQTEDESFLFEIQETYDIAMADITMYYQSLQEQIKTGDLDGTVTGNSVSFTYIGTFMDEYDGEQVMMHFFACRTYIVGALVKYEDDEAMQLYKEIMEEIGWVA